ncbi:MAG TPA: ABC transporter permease [Bryobacteraceae bacterium]|nr:ABC transporter permease [Bryobacteraceae bacterium]HOQ46712.1 ABC transporter permease [Bryobacteraceae bacterium]HPQ14057.1 ABC transporter permease [Bryobacteraceae bacterium]HPU72382.1 ABC transporter permease [Bryobacteraceae bacterium]
MFVHEALRFSLNALKVNKVRSFLTALGLVIGNASVIWVVTISLTSRDYILEQIQGIGSNIIYAQYAIGNQTTSSQVAADYVKMADVEAVRRQLGDQIIAATGIMQTFTGIVVNGREQEIQVNGSDEHYRKVRNLVLLSGRFLDSSDVALRQKVALLTEKLANRLFGGQDAAVGQVIKIHGLQFTVIGTFKEKVSSFGLSELAGESILIPITVMSYFVPVERIDPMYVQARSTAEVPAVTEAVRQILESRHRPGAKYLVENLTAILDAANKIALVLTAVLVMVSAIALVISGIGIMNIMLVTVTERTREIGVRMAVGAARRDILQQFLMEAVVISVAGGLAGILIGVALPLSVRFLMPEVEIPISKLSIAIAFVVSCTVGLVFGMLPASRAARLNPTEALRYE